MFRLFTFFASIVFVAQAHATCLDLFNARGTTNSSVTEAIDCYKGEANKSTDPIAKADALNKIGYLYFFVGAFGREQAADANLQDSMAAAKQSATLFGTWMDEAHYKTLGDQERLAISNSLYVYGTSLARASERSGTITVITKWPEIQKVMKMVMSLGHPEVYGYGAHRTLAIANTRMPPIAGGNKKLAEQYLTLAISKTDRAGVSTYPANNYFYADLLLRLSRKQEGCAQLQKVASLTDEQVALSEPGIFEASRDRSDAQAALAKECSK